MTKLLTTVFFLLCTLNCFSTCIAIYIGENKHIYVAADSRRTFFFNNDKNGPRFESICKIHNVGATYFAIAGIDDGGLLKAATTALQQNTNVDSAIKSFGAAMVKRYTRLMTDTRLYYPDKFKHFLNDGLANISFFGFYGGEPTVQNIEFLFYLDDNNQIVVSFRTHVVAVLTIIGMSKDITNAKPEELPAKETMEENPRLYVESLVKFEAKKQPLAVSEPIDLLELGPDGPLWIKKNEAAVSY